MTDAGPHSPVVELPQARKALDLLRFAPGGDDVLLAVQSKRQLTVWELQRPDVPLHEVESGSKVVGAMFWPDEGGVLVWTERGAQVLDFAQEEIVAQVPRNAERQKSQNVAARVLHSIGTGLSFVPMAAGGVWSLLPLLASSASAQAHHFASADISADARRLAAIAHNHRVYAYDLHSGERIAEWKIAMSERSRLVWLPSGHVAVGINSKLMILDPAEKKPIFKKTAHLSGVRGVIRMPGGHLATIGENQNLRTWTEVGEPVSGVIKLRKQVEEAFPIDATRLLARATNRKLYLIDTEAKPAMNEVRTVGIKITALAVSDDGSHTALAGTDRIVRVYETRALLGQDAGA